MVHLDLQAQLPLALLIIAERDSDTEFLLRELREAGAQPTSRRVATLEALVAALEEPSWTLVIWMSSSSHLSAIEACRVSKQKTEFLPFIVVAEPGEEDIGIAAVQAGADDYFIRGRGARLLPAIQRELRRVKERLEHQLVLQALQCSQASLAEAQRIAQLGNWELNLETDELTWSEEIYRIFGLSPAKVAPSRELFIKSVHPEDRDLVRKAVAEALRSGNAYDTEHRIVLPDGSRRIVHERAEVIRSATGDAVRMIGTVQDITERRELEEKLLQSQKLESIGLLAGGIAHDFNNLLTAITGYANLTLAKLRPEDPLCDSLLQIQKATELAVALTQQLLAFSRKQLLQPKVLDLNSIVSNSASMLRRVIGEDIEVKTLLEADLPNVKADPVQVEQVIMNLVVNARDAMPKGGKLTVETASITLNENYVYRHGALLPGRYAMLAVSDTGSGMDAETQSRIFEPFFTTKTKGHGTGLGLSTVYGIIKQSGGNIWVYSEPGKGTTFKIYLPIVNEPADKIARPVVTEGTRGIETILLVEDEDLVRRLANQVLRLKGYQVLEASTGSEALEICKGHQGPIHLVVTDTIMPRMGGPELGRRLAEIRPALKVLYMSGYTDNSIADYGVLDETNFLQKPFTPEALSRKVREVLDMPRRESAAGGG